MKILILSLLLISGCSHTLNEAGSKVKLSKNEPSRQCTEVGDVDGGGFGTVSISEAKKDLRNKAAEVGGNYVVYDSITNTNQNITVNGRAFDCPKGR